MKQSDRLVAFVNEAIHGTNSNIAIINSDAYVSLFIRGSTPIDLAATYVRIIPVKGELVIETDKALLSVPLRCPIYEAYTTCVPSGNGYRLACRVIGMHEHDRLDIRFSDPSKAYVTQTLR